MRWPIHPIECVRPSRFHPPFCPRPTCSAHTRPGRGFRHEGWYLRQRRPRRVKRFRCLACGKRFPKATFSADYYLKRPELLEPVAAGLVAGSAHRQIARTVGCSKTSVTRLAERIGRHAILLFVRCRRHVGLPAEAVVHDHFESFVARQDRGLGLGTALGLRSWFVYDLDPAPHRASGRRPDREAHTPGAHPRAARAYVVSIRRTLHRLLASARDGDAIDVHVDGRGDYRVAVRHPSLRDRVRLHVFANPKRGPKGSPRARRRGSAIGPCFPAIGTTR